MILTAPTFTKTSLESTEQVVGFSNIAERISKNALQKFDNTWRETDAMERCDFIRFPSFFSNGTIVATLQISGPWASEKDELNIGIWE